MIKSVFGNKKKNQYFGIKTFTYYLPAPPSRKSGYQEKEFDRLIQHIMAQGYELIDIKTQSHSKSDQAGIWIICILGAPSKSLYEAKIQYDLSLANADSIEGEYPLDPSIIHES